MNKLAERQRHTPMAEMLEWLESTNPWGFRGLGLAPYVRIEDYVEDDTFVLRAELPGVDPEKDIDVQLDNDVLTISGERREETKDKNHREFHYGSFTRSVPLPAGTKPEEVTATYSEGVLEVRVPIATAEVPQPRRISVKHGS
jgi:HSP20 family protein